MVRQLQTTPRVRKISIFCKSLDVNGIVEMDTVEGFVGLTISTQYKRLLATNLFPCFDHYGGYNFRLFRKVNIIDLIAI